MGQFLNINDTFLSKIRLLFLTTVKLTVLLQLFIIMKNEFYYYYEENNNILNFIIINDVGGVIVNL